MRRLAVFDIDGTLTDTNAVDDDCFVRAVADTLRLDASALDARTMDWSNAPHVTDSALLGWLCEQHCDRPLRDGEADATIHRLLDLMHAELASNPARFRPIAGAADAFRPLRGIGWEIAFATGAWEASARLKLAAAGLDSADYVLASSSDAPTRTEIMELAVRRAARFGAEEFNRIVSIGDGLWDVRAARELGWPFVAIASGQHADRMRAAGAVTILPDLADTAALCAALESATVPGVTTSAAATSS